MTKINRSAGQIQNALKSGRLHAHNTLRKRDSEQISKTLLDVQRRRVGVVPALGAMSLDAGVTNIGVTKSTYETNNDPNVIKRGVKVGVNQGKNQLTIGERTVLVSATWAEFDHELREDAAFARDAGEGDLDTTYFYTLGRNMMIDLEDQAINGIQETDKEGNTCKGLLQITEASDVTLNAAEIGALNGTRTYNNGDIPNGSLVEDAFLKGCKALDSNYFTENRVIVIPNNASSALGKQWSQFYGSGTIREHLMKLPGVIAVVQSDVMPDDTYAIFTASPDCVDVVMPMTFQPFQWQNNPIETNGLILTIHAVRWKVDSRGKTGIAILKA